VEEEINESCTTLWRSPLRACSEGVDVYCHAKVLTKHPLGVFITSTGSSKGLRELAARMLSVCKCVSHTSERELRANVCAHWPVC